MKELTGVVCLFIGSGFMAAAIATVIINSQWAVLAEVALAMLLLTAGAMLFDG